uniref:Uncharacterized protein n=1 Tax=Romanomermis culicivorax TaxID=13658 RepID=A0A915IBM7_ROMCU
MDIPIAAKRVANGSTYEMMDASSAFKTTLKSTGTVGKQTFSRIADASTESARKVNRSSAPISPATTENQKEYLLWFILPMCKTRSIKMRSNTGLLDESIWAQEDC